KPVPDEPVIDPDNESVFEPPAEELSSEPMVMPAHDKTIDEPSHESPLTQLPIGTGSEPTTAPEPEEQSIDFDNESIFEPLPEDLSNQPTIMPVPDEPAHETEHEHFVNQLPHDSGDNTAGEHPPVAGNGKATVGPLLDDIYGKTTVGPLHDETADETGHGTFDKPLIAVAGAETTDKPLADQINGKTKSMPDDTADDTAGEPISDPFANDTDDKANDQPVNNTPDAEITFSSLADEKEKTSVKPAPDDFGNEKNGKPLSNEKTVSSFDDETKITILEKELSDDNETTLVGGKTTPHPEPEKVGRKRKKTGPSDSQSSFTIDDIHRKLGDEMADIPDEYSEEFDAAQMSSVIQENFPGKSAAEKIKINRHFLMDAEPFHLDKFVENIKKKTEGMLTGFRGLDGSICLPANDLTLVTSQPKHGKTCFMLNMFLNMCRMYPNKHFIFYTYEESKYDVMLKLINMCGSKLFPKMEGINSNIQHWIYEFKHADIEKLKEKAEKNVAYSGLSVFLQLSNKVHVIDNQHNCADLMDSIRSFEKAFEVGAVFIDSLHSIRMEKEQSRNKRADQFLEISENLRRVANITNFPLILSAQLTSDSKGGAEYDDLWVDNLKEAGNPDHAAGLVIGLQNYSRSQYVGSNFNREFKSDFYATPLEKAEPMPSNLKDMMRKTIILAKVLANSTGDEPETELLFHKQLLKISDFNDES
ncbi:MAG: hypothetical protein GY765_41250, partial [bacterium]|nr:hypothetical protein [bacterium]